MNLENMDPELRKTLAVLIKLSEDYDFVAPEEIDNSFKLTTIALIELAEQVTIQKNEIQALRKAHEIFAQENI